MGNEGEFAVKNDSNVFVLIYNLDFSVVKFKYWVKVEFPLVAEVDAFRLFLENSSPFSVVHLWSLSRLIWSFLSM